jgi:hypothetical protein
MIKKKSEEKKNKQEKQILSFCILFVLSGSSPKKLVVELCVLFQELCEGMAFYGVNTNFVLFFARKKEREKKVAGQYNQYRCRWCMKMTGDNSSSWCCVIGGAKDAVQSTPRH